MVTTSDRLSTAETAFRELLTPEGREDPYPRYAALRELSPVHASRLGPLVLTRYDDCAAVLRDATFLVHDENWLDATTPNWRDRPATGMTGRSLIFRQAPDHTRLRRLVSGAFTARRVAALHDMVEGYVNGLLDDMAAAGGDGGVIDIREMLALPLPVAVISALLGVPEADWVWLRGLAADLTPIVDFFASGADFDKADEAAREFGPYFVELANERRREPAGDMISGLVAAQDGDRLTEDEVVETIMLLFVAGFETSVNLITNVSLALMQHPEQWAVFGADPLGLAEQVVEESLRYDAPVQGASRIAGEDTSVAGVRVRAGKEVWTLLGAANRDPAEFDDPDRFDVTRTGSKVATFGFGTHFCLGAPLARLEGKIAFPALVRRFPRLAQAGPRVRRNNFNLRGFTEFPVTVR
jgi:cytochrome P450